MFKHLRVPIDGSGLSERAAQVSLGRAARLGAWVTAFSVEPPPAPPTVADEAVARARHSARHEARTSEHAASVRRRSREPAAALGVAAEGHFARRAGVEDAIVHAAASCGCDLVVMVTRGRGKRTGIPVGSHPESLIDRTERPLLALH